MTGPSFQNVPVGKLAQAYVALALAQDVAKRCIDERCEEQGLQPLLTVLNVTAKLLEEMLENELNEQSLTDFLPTPCPDLLM